MMTEYPDDIAALIQRREELERQLSALPYDGTTEIKDNGGRRYVYVRKKLGTKLTTTYVGLYSEELAQQVRRITAESKAIRKEIRHISHVLKRLADSKPTDGESHAKA